MTTKTSRQPPYRLALALWRWLGEILIDDSPSMHFFFVYPNHHSPLTLICSTSIEQALLKSFSLININKDDALVAFFKTGRHHQQSGSGWSQDLGSGGGRGKLRCRSNQYTGCLGLSTPGYSTSSIFKVR